MGESEDKPESSIYVNKFQNVMLDLSKFTAAHDNLTTATSNVVTYCLIIYAFLIYPVLHIFYKETSKMFFTMALCIIILGLMTIGPMYGWMSTILFN